MYKCCDKPSGGRYLFAYSASLLTLDPFAAPSSHVWPASNIFRTPSTTQLLDRHRQRDFLPAFPVNSASQGKFPLGHLTFRGHFHSHTLWLISYHQQVFQPQVSLISADTATLQSYPRQVIRPHFSTIAKPSTNSMCLVTPFTLPCCRRIYVSAERLPSCPDGWPKKKCPKELCVQISGFEPKDVDNRSTGICWRCLAWNKDIGPFEREILRPVLDKAFIAEGLGDVPMDERRVRMETAGICWHCGACGDCASCGTGIEARKAKENELDGWDRRGKKRVTEADVKQGRNKMARVGQARGSIISLNSSSPASSSPSMGMVPSGYPANPFEQRPRDHPLQQYKYNSGQAGYDQFRLALPTINYQGQQMALQPPIPQAPSGSWQGISSSQKQEVSGVRDGSVPVDPSLEQPPKVEETKTISDLNLPLSRQKELDLPPFNLNWVSQIPPLNHMSKSHKY